MVSGGAGIVDSGATLSTLSGNHCEEICPEGADGGAGIEHVLIVEFRVVDWKYNWSGRVGGMGKNERCWG